MGWPILSLSHGPGPEIGWRGGEVASRDFNSALRLFSESEREDVEERAAIIEFEAGIKRDESRTEGGPRSSAESM